MKNAFQKALENRSARVLILLFSVLIAIVTYTLIYSYFVQLNLHEEKVLSRLEAIAKTTASQVDGNILKELLAAYPKEDDITTNTQNAQYKDINRLLRTIKSKNQLNSEIYTLTFDRKEESIFFGVSSSETPFYRHPYDHFPQELLDHYETGGMVGVYEDHNGHWLSAFAPIRDSTNTVIAVVQADNLFDEFITKARNSILKNIAYSLALMLLLIIFLIRSVRNILNAEDKLTNALRDSKNILEQKNEDILDSIKYAHKIQEAILTKPSEFERIFADSFIFFLPRDIVSGDFYWFKQMGKYKIVACVDCTGHGVPGAFMSMIGSILLDEIITKQGTTEPQLILDKLHEMVVDSLKQNTDGADSKDGMDIAICVVDEEKNNLSYSGACRPLVYIRNGEVIQIKADPFPIGGISYCKNGYQKFSIELEDGDRFYIFSDGYPDQFGGEKSKKYMTPKFRKFLLSISSKPMNIQKTLLKNEFNRWKGDEEQVDDVIVMGFRV